LHYLFGAFRTNINNIPAYISYLKTSATGQICKFQSKNDKPTIGISWRSANENSSPWTTGRNIDLKLLLSSIDLNDFNLVPIQRGITDNELKVLRSVSSSLEIPILDSLPQTAKQILNCDLILSTCTMIPHLSGALGVPTFTLLSTNSCWRWLIDRCDTPWYPNMRLFRQSFFNDWNKPLNDLRFHFKKFILTSI
jgi:hypothetical protein